MHAVGLSFTVNKFCSRWSRRLHGFRVKECITTVSYEKTYLWRDFFSRDSLTRPDKHGWKIEKGLCVTEWITQSPALNALLELTKCSCATGCDKTLLMQQKWPTLLCGLSMCFMHQFSNWGRQHLRFSWFWIWRLTSDFITEQEKIELRGRFTMHVERENERERMRERERPRGGGGVKERREREGGRVHG